MNIEFLLLPLCVGLVLLPYAFHRFWLITIARKAVGVNANSLFINSVTLLPASLAFWIFIYVEVAQAAIYLRDAQFADIGFVSLMALLFYTIYQFTVRAGLRDKFALSRRVRIPYQIWMQDLVVGGLALGCALSLLVGIAVNAERRLVVSLIALEMSELTLSFFIALSVLRYCDMRCGRQRAIWLGWILIAGAIPGVAVLILLPAWNAFLTALSRMPESDEKKMARID